MTEPKTQEEWLEHFGDLAERHADMLARPIVDFLADKIILTREEVREAREDDETGCCDFLRYDEGCDVYMGDDGNYMPLCHLCKKLTEFAKGEEDE